VNTFRHRATSAALALLLPALLILGLAGPASAVTPSQQAKLAASDAAKADQLGAAAALSSDGSTALLGAPGKNHFTGGAYVFTRVGTTWSQQQKLAPSDPAQSDQFGAAVALSSDGNTAIVGSPNKATATGAAYVFTRVGSTWTQQQKLTASPGANGNRFAASVDLSADGNTAAIGAPGKSSSAGAVYIFTRAGSVWTQQTALTPSDAAANDQFGASVALNSSGTLLAGAPHKATNAGAAYAFTGSGSTWTQQQKLTVSGGASGDLFGSAVSLDGDGNIGVLGAPGEGSLAGAGYIFTRSGNVWSQGTHLVSSNQTIGNQLGASVAISSDGLSVLLGSPGVKRSTGAALLFLGPAWDRQPKIVGSDSVVSDAFGSSVATNSDGTTHLVGADGTVAATGSGYVFTVAFPPAIAHVQPSSGQVGASVVITGSHFTGATTVSFNGTTSVFTVDNDGQITATVPADAITGKITVTTPAGSDTSTNSFKVKPSITDFSPPLGPVGTLVTINGTGLAGTTGVAFNNVAATFTIVNSGQVTATVPTGTPIGTGKISVTTAGGTVKSKKGFRVTP